MASCFVQTTADRWDALGGLKKRGISNSQPSFAKATARRGKEYPISNIQYPISNIQYPMSNVQCPMSNVQCPMSKVHGA